MDRIPEIKRKMATVLVVEDSPTQRDALRFLLDESGYSVVVASNGREGFEVAKANAIDLVISDIVMPELDGYGLCRSLRANEAFRHLPVILLTSLSDPQDVIRGLEAGADNFICKPYEDAALLARVRNVLANQEMRKCSNSEMGISIFFAGQRFNITADRLQILDLLLSTYENAVQQNAELKRVRDELRILNEQLEAQVAVRTADLSERVKQVETLSRFPEENRSPVLRVGSDGTLLYANPSAGLILQCWGCEPGRKLPEEWITRIHDSMSTGLRQEVELECEGRSFALDFCPVMVADYVNVYGYDITERKRSKETLAIHNRIATIFGTTSSEAMYDEVLEIALKTTHSPLGVFGYVDENGDCVVPTMARQAWDNCQIPEKTMRFPKGTWENSSWPRALREKQVIYSNEPFSKVPAGHVTIQRHVSIPILYQSEPIGLFQVANKETEYTEVDILTLANIAEHVAPLLNARLKREWAQRSMHESEERYRSLFENATMGIYRTTEDGRILLANPALVKMLGYPSLADLRGVNLEQEGQQKKFSRSQFKNELKRQDSLASFETTWIRVDGKGITVRENARVVRDKDGNGIYYEGYVEDITGQKEAEDREQLFRETLDALNRGENADESIRLVLQLIKKHMNIEAVGIRLKKGDDFPYFFTDGFTEDFVQVERYLCERDAMGNIVYDSDGNAVLECMCGNVIRGQTNPALPFFTEGGSFWTNGTTALLASTAEMDRQACTRNRCNGDGYESVALIPLKSGNEIIGLLQLNDHRPDQFTLDMIQFLVGLGASIGIALARKQATEAKSVSELRYRRLFESAKDGILILDAETGNVVDVNPYLANLLGYPTKDFLGKKLWELGLFADFLPNQANFEELKEKEYIRYEDRPLRCADGRKVDVEFVSNVYPVSGHNVIQCNIRDITKRHAAERELLEAKRLTDLIVENVPLVIFLKDAQNMRFIALNKAGEDFSGYACKDVIGKTNSDLFPLEQATFFTAIDKKAIESGLSQDILIAPVVTANKGVRMIHARVLRIDAVNGVSNYLIGIVEDITERIKAEEEIHALNIDLESKVQERTAQFQFVNKELEAFSYSISHDLKAPLRSIAGFSQAVIEDYADLLPAEGQEDLRRVKDEAIRMGVLIEDLLRLSRLGKQEMSIEAVDLTALALSLLEGRTLQEPDRQVQFVLDPDVKIHADPILIRVLMDNLLANAWKFTSKMVDACIQVRRCPCEAGWSRFSISDNGAGFDPAYVERIFAPFRRLHTTEEFPGTGIGLAIVHRIVQRHGATIVAEGSPGKGATFTLTFPEPQP